MKLSTKEQNDKRQQLGRMSTLAPPPPHPGSNALEIRGARANGLLSPALSSKGGEGDIRRCPIESKDVAVALSSSGGEGWGGLRAGTLVTL